VKEDSYPKYLLRAVITASAFVKAKEKQNKHVGLLILLGPQKKLKKICSEFEGDLKDIILSKYENPILYSNKIFEVYEEMGKRDGALFFDTAGNLLASEIYIEGMKTSRLTDIINDIKNIKGSIGARHLAGAYASLNGLDAVIVSEEKGTVITIRNGKICKELCYDPKKGFLGKIDAKRIAKSID
jgi:DNA integrity scanning protein DisA with diadenylate cyclase activity